MAEVHSIHDRQQPYLRLHSIDVYVRDQERSLRFYVDKLGFELAFDARLQSGQRWVGVSPPHGTAVLTLIQPAPQSPEAKLIGRATRAIFVTDDIAGTFAQWSARGVHFRHTPRLRRIKYERQAAPAEGEGPVWGEIFTRFEDLDRNSFALVSFDEVNKAIEIQRRAHAEKMEAERRAEQEIEIARQVQARLFPQALPEPRTLEYAGLCLQARQVGGDYYDFLHLSQDRFGLVIGDIAGKGIAAALLMANLQANLRSQCALALEQPQHFLRSVNRLFYDNTAPSAYATLFFAEYDDRVQILRYINCGHLSGLVLRNDDRLERLESTGTVLGMFSTWDCELGQCRLNADDTLALYTDGVTEAASEGDEEFGEARLLAALRRNRARSPKEIVASILSDVQAFSKDHQQDDITLIVAKCRDGATTTASYSAEPAL